LSLDFDIGGCMCV